MQCLKTELYAVTAVTAVMTAAAARTMLASRNQEKQENDPAG